MKKRQKARMATTRSLPSFWVKMKQCQKVGTAIALILAISSVILFLVSTNRYDYGDMWKKASSNLTLGLVVSAIIAFLSLYIDRTHLSKSEPGETETWICPHCGKTVSGDLEEVQDHEIHVTCLKCGAHYKTKRPEKDKVYLCKKCGEKIIVKSGESNL